MIELLAGEHKKIETGAFSNDMTTFSTADDVLTLLIHLGYLGYDFSTKEVFIPNSEIASEFVAAIQGAGWDTVINVVKKSDSLLKATWNKNAEAVAEGIEEAHFETSMLKYNDENSLACVISLAYYSARAYYTEIRELPTDKGYADVVYLPRKNHKVGDIILGSITGLAMVLVHYVPVSVSVIIFVLHSHYWHGTGAFV